MQRAEFLTLTSAFALTATSSPAPRSAWLAMTISMNRCFAPFALSIRGRTRTGLFWIDSGGGKLILAREFVRDLGLRSTGAPELEGEQRFVPLEPPDMRTGNIQIPIAPGDIVMLDSPGFMPGVGAQGILPLRLFRDHAVTFDYDEHRLGIDTPGITGTEVPVEIAQASGFVRMPVRIGNDDQHVLLDTGASCTMLSQTAMDRLRDRYADWKTVRGAYGDANMLGGDLEVNAQMMLIKSMTVAGVELRNVSVVSRPAGTFENWMSSLTTAPIVGSLAGNVLRNFDVTVDYPNSRTIFSGGTAQAVRPFDLVPLTLTPLPSGSYSIAGILDAPAFAAVRSKVIGTRLRSVDGTAVDGLVLSDVHRLLRGSPGTSKRVTVDGPKGPESYDLAVIALWGAD